MNFNHFVSLHGGLILVAFAAVFFMGCIAPQDSPAVPATAAPTAQVTAGISTVPVATVTALPPTLTASLPSGVTISYPRDWERKDVGTTDLRDYGRSTLNIANFFSPVATSGDPGSYTSLSIDIDQTVDIDLEQYFNLATLALGKYYGQSFDITKHSYQLKVSDYKSYELDWQSNDKRGIYIFTEAKGDVYIFAFKSPNTPAASGAYTTEIMQMYKSVSLNPPDVTSVKQR